MALGDAMWSAHSFDEDELRLLNWTLAGERGGVPSIGDLAVTPQGTPNTTVQVATGQAIVPATSAGLHGAWHVPNIGALTSPAFGAAGGSPRWDLLLLQVVAGVPQLTVVVGTPAGSPSEPSLAAYSDYTILARIQMPAGKSIIDNGANGVIVDRRSMLPPYFPCTSTTRPQSPFNGQEIWESDTGRKYVWNGSAWLPVPVGKRFNSGTFTGTTDGAGVVTFAHGLGLTPTAVMVNLTTASTTGTIQVGKAAIGALTTTNVSVTFIRSDSGAVLGGNAVVFQWIAVS